MADIGSEQSLGFMVGNSIIDGSDLIINWNGFELIAKDFRHSHEKGGRLDKLWLQDIKTGRIFLVKGCSNFNWEPFSEKLAYIIGKNLGLDALEYDILEASMFKGLFNSRNPFCKYVSICEKIDRRGCSITSVAEIKRARNAIKDDDEKPITNREVMFELLSDNYIDTMLLFDAIIGNQDRHYGNVHLLRTDNGEMVGAPLLDNGASLLASVPTPLLVLSGNKVGEWFNKAFTIEKTHDLQMKWVSGSISNISFNVPLKTLEILNEMQPVLDLMPKIRAQAIKKYVVYRIHKYLGMIKYSNNEEYLKLHKTKWTARENEESSY